MKNILEPEPSVLFHDGRFVQPAMRRHAILEADIITAARENHGIDSIDEIKSAILEATGEISVIPKS